MQLENGWMDGWMATGQYGLPVTSRPPIATISLFINVIITSSLSYVLLRGCQAPK